MDNNRIDIDSLVDFCENTAKNYAKVEENSFTEYIQNNVVNNFYYSLLYILHENFRNIPIDKKETFIEDWKSAIYNIFKKNKRKYKKEDNQIITGGLLSSNKSILDQVIQVIVDIEDINIYIVNFNKHIIKVYYSKDSLNIYKKNIFIESKNNIYFPIMNNNNGIFCANNKIIQEIVNNDSMFNVTRNDGSSIVFLSKSEIESSFIEKEPEVKNESVDNALKEYFVSKDINFNKSGLNKIKIAELKDICGKFNIEINGKKKVEIVELILNF